MSKIHVVEVKITNHTDLAFEYNGDWFDSGRVADGNAWPNRIEPNTTILVKCYEKDWSMAGCSGWVKYKIGGVTVFFTFSNPSAGSNGIDVGTDSSVWDEMTSHYDTPATKTMKLHNDNLWLTADIESTGGGINRASWNLKTLIKKQ